MKMNRLISVLLVIMLVMISAAPALALTSVEKEQQYAAAIDQLETWLEGGHDVSELQGTYDAFKELGGYEQSRFMAYYTDVLIRIEDGVFNTMTEFELDTLQNDADFVKYLTDDLGGSIGTPEMLRAYAAARKLEQEGNAVEAAAVYKTCLSFYDSLERYEAISVALFTGHYEKGLELTEAGDLEGAYAELAQAGGWEDSAIMMAYIEKTLGYNPMEHVHDWQPVTCTTPKTCTGCGNTKGEALGHQWDEGTVTIPATCISEGVMTYNCIVCGETKTESIAADGENHSWQDASYDAPKTCAWCGATEGDALPQLVESVPESTPQVGSYVTFGHYPQTAEGNDNTPIEWLVLDYDAENDRILLVSHYALDYQMYNYTDHNVTWETCSLREWLNDDFLNKAFTETEQKTISLTSVDNSATQCFDWTLCGFPESGPDVTNTRDKVFLLSYGEANKYFNLLRHDFDNTKSRVAPTAYSFEKSNQCDDGEQTEEGLPSVSWWLRSPGPTASGAIEVWSGSFSLPGAVTNHEYIRPAIWMKLSAVEDNYEAAEENAVIDNAAESAILQQYAVGNYVTYGYYPQTESGNDNTPIEWLVLDVKGNKALLLSRYGLDCQPYNSIATDTTWETCTLRAWLNNEFISQAFTEQEQQAILTTTLKNDKRYGCNDTDGGNDTQDRVFLLSYWDVKKYIGFGVQHISTRVAPTEYAIGRGAKTFSSKKTADGMAAGYWWLRSPGQYLYEAVYVSPNGEVNDGSVYSFHLSVRPAFWLDLSGL